MKLVNVGCGKCFHNDWINIDKYPSSNEVTAHDIDNGLPFADSTADAVYSSHLIEHLTTTEAEALAKEINRVLRHGGIVRIVTPNLEEIVNLYQEKLARTLLSDDIAEREYEWMLLELFDQVSRKERGGEMGRFLLRKDLQTSNFVRGRVGSEVDEYWRDLDNVPTLREKLHSVNFTMLQQYLRNRIAKGLVHAVAGREAAKAFEEGLFRQSGEIHYRLYDRYSLGKLLAAAGFVDIKSCRADESGIPDFNSYGLDMINGTVRKPDSLFMEAVKP